MDSLITIIALIAAVGALMPPYTPDPYASLTSQSHAETNATNLEVDLGYERYQGVANETTGLNTWLGIRFAASTADRRWQVPAVPAVNRDDIIQANVLPPRCPQSPRTSTDPAVNITGSEDCLFLNVFAPKGATKLPVMIWIHSGGYGQGDGGQDQSLVINANEGAFVVVSIQYRLGAFGFLSSEEVMQNGVVNAGLLDQILAIEWVKAYIHLFGVEPERVTVTGVSSGAGSVMLHAMAYGGSLEDSLFTNLQAFSPFLPQQHGYADALPTQYYEAFASTAGCKDEASRFECLQKADTAILQDASAAVSNSSAYYGTWAFLPVTDGTLLQTLPSIQLRPDQPLNGCNLQVSNVANEGGLFVPFNIKTADALTSFISLTYPSLSSSDLSRLQSIYPFPPPDFPANGTRFATTGVSPPTALTQSTFGTGYQQLALVIYAESTLVCPSYWLAEAFSSPLNQSSVPLPASQQGRKAWKSQYSVPSALHGDDQVAYFGPPLPNQEVGLKEELQRALGRFIVQGDPNNKINGNGDDEGEGAGAGGAAGAGAESIPSWPPWDPAHPMQMNMNTTGGVPYQYESPLVPGVSLTQSRGPGLKNSFEVVDADTWEGGRGERCRFWRDVGMRVPA